MFNIRSIKVKLQVWALYTKLRNPKLLGVDQHNDAITKKKEKK